MSGPGLGGLKMILTRTHHRILASSHAVEDLPHRLRGKTPTAQSLWRGGLRVGSIWVWGSGSVVP